MSVGAFYDDREIYFSLTSNDEGRAVLRCLVGAGALHMLVSFRTVQLLYQNHFLSGTDLRNIMDYCDENCRGWRHQQRYVSRVEPHACLRGDPPPGAEGDYSSHGTLHPPKFPPWRRPRPQ